MYWREVEIFKVLERTALIFFQGNLQRCDLDSHSLVWEVSEYPISNHGLSGANKLSERYYESTWWIRADLVQILTLPLIATYFQWVNEHFWASALFGYKTEMLIFSLQSMKIRVTLNTYSILWNEMLPDSWIQIKSNKS